MALMGRKKSKKIPKKSLLEGSYVILGLAMVLWAFSLPWLDYECGGFSEFVLGFPESQMIPGWRLPSFARDAEQTWIVRISQLFGASSEDRAQVWLVYLSPISGLLALGYLGAGRKKILRYTAILANAALLFVLIKHLQQPVPEPPLPGVSVKLGHGVLLSAVGHGFLCWAGLFTNRS